MQQVHSFRDTAHTILQKQHLFGFDSVFEWFGSFCSCQGTQSYYDCDDIGIPSRQFWLLSSMVWLRPR
jgi:hypothetical protein